MALYVALCYYDRDLQWDPVPDVEFTPEYTEFARRATEAGVMRGGEALYPVTMSTTITVSGGQGGDVLVDRRPLRRGEGGPGRVLPAGGGRPRRGHRVGGAEPGGLAGEGRAPPGGVGARLGSLVWTLPALWPRC